MQMAQIIQSLFIGWSTAVESEAFKGLRADKNLKNCCDLIAFGKLSRPFCSISKSYISVKKVKAAWKQQKKFTFKKKLFTSGFFKYLSSLAVWGLDYR